MKAVSEMHLHGIMFHQRHVRRYTVRSNSHPDSQSYTEIDWKRMNSWLLMLWRSLLESIPQCWTHDLAQLGGESHGRVSHGGTWEEKKKTSVKLQSGQNPLKFGGPALLKWKCLKACKITWLLFARINNHSSDDIVLLRVPCHARRKSH